MFGLFRGSNIENELESKYNEIADVVSNVLVAGGVGIASSDAAIVLTKESLSRVEGKDLIKCRTNVPSLFAMMAAANAAFEDGDEDLAQLICDACKNLASQISSVSPESYNDLEYTMVRNSFEFMLNIDKNIEVR